MASVDAQAKPQAFNVEQIIEELLEVRGKRPGKQASLSEA